MTQTVRGLCLDSETRCTHYHSSSDIIAIKMFCCGIYYACKECHDLLADHPREVWPVALWNAKAILCGHCGEELSVSAYMGSGYKCPACDAAFNSGCRNHYHFYFSSTGEAPGGDHG